MRTYKRLFDKDVSEFYDNMNVNDEGRKAGLAVGAAMLIALVVGILLYAGTVKDHEATTTMTDTTRNLPYPDRTPGQTEERHMLPATTR